MLKASCLCSGCRVLLTFNFNQNKKESAKCPTPKDLFARGNVGVGGSPFKF